MIHSPRGVEDVLPPRVFYYNWIEREADFLFPLYGYQKIIIPTFESTELFERSVGRETDVGKQMYTFKDKKGRTFSLRPEATAGVVRAYLEHKLYPGERKFYYWGSMFRYERPQAGRLREFRQVGVEALGISEGWLDVEVISLAHSLFQRLGIPPSSYRIKLNSLGCRKCRPSYVEVLKKFLGSSLSSLCEVCQERGKRNPLRVLDCKKKECRSSLYNVPLIKDYLCKECKEHFQRVRKGLGILSLEFEEDPRLVRGLDYYTRTVFEFISSPRGGQDTFCAGGRYDDLVEELGGPSVPAIGFAAGVERIIFLLEKLKLSPPSLPEPSFYLIPLEEEAKEKSLKLAKILREQNFPAEIDLTFRSLKAKLRKANKEKVKWLILIGEEEIKEGVISLRNMETGQQKKVKEKDFSRWIKSIEESK